VPLLFFCIGPPSTPNPSGTLSHTVQAQVVLVWECQVCVKSLPFPLCAAAVKHWATPFASSQPAASRARTRSGIQARAAHALDDC
jgi:hypothetical protein